MAIKRIGLDQMEQEPFLIVFHKIIRNAEISDQALGMLIRLMALPDSWDFTYSGYSMIYPKSGTGRIASTIKELEALGYVKNKKPRDSKGHYLKGVLTITYNPYSKNPVMEKTNMGNTDRGNATEGYRNMENQYNNIIY